MKENAFERRPEKNEIRNKILSQFFTYAKDAKEVVVNSLPGKHWLWENSLVSISNIVLPKTYVELNCYEKEASLWETFPYHPEAPLAACGENVWVDYACGTNIDFNYKQTNISNETVSSVFSWADYCGWPTPDKLDRFSKAIHQGHVIYLTFALNWRGSSTIDKRVLKYKEANGSEAAEHALMQRLRQIVKNKMGENATEIFYASYVGGYNNPMVTVGWHFVKNSSIPKIEYVPENSLKKTVYQNPDKESYPEIRELLKQGETDEKIFARFKKLSKMQLAGIKAYESRKRNLTHA